MFEGSVSVTKTIVTTASLYPRKCLLNLTYVKFMSIKCIVVLVHDNDGSRNNDNISNNDYGMIIPNFSMFTLHFFQKDICLNKI